MTNAKTDVPEPPKFDHDDIPEPPKLESFSIPETHDKELSIPEPPRLEDIPEPPAMPEMNIEQKRKGFLGIFKKDRKVFKNDAALEAPPVLVKVTEPLKVEKDISEVVPPPPIQLNKAEDKKEVKQEDVSFAPKFDKSSDVPMPPTFELKEIPEKIKEPKKIQEGLKLESVSITDIPMPPTFELKNETINEMKTEELHNDEFSPPIAPLPVPQSSNIEEEPYWLKEGEEFEKNTPLTDVEGVGEQRAKLLRKAGIKTAEHLAKADHKVISKKTKIPILHAKKIIGHAKRITALKNRLKTQNPIKKAGNISEVISQLEEEKKAIVRIQKSSIDEDKTLELEGHKEVVQVLEKLEKKRNELTELQTRLAEKESKLSGHEDSYKRDMDYIENLKRRLDHDVRERTQYLINLEKEYFQKAQKLASQQTEISVKEKDLAEKERILMHKENELKRKMNELEDRGISVETKEKKLGKIMEQLDTQDTLLKEKEEELVKREAEYLKKLDTLENHEKTILKQLEEKRKSLEKKEKEIETTEDRVYKKQRNVDKQSVAVEYAKNVVEEEKGKLIDDEFEQYLRDQLRGLNGISYNDVNVVTNLKVGLEDSKRPVYQLVDQCRELLRGNRVSEAKVYYNQLRDRYYSMSFANQSEKQNVHNQIRQLYDEINLADIGKN